MGPAVPEKSSAPDGGVGGAARFGCHCGAGGLERGHPGVLLASVGRSRAVPGPGGVRPRCLVGAGGPGRGCCAGPASGRLRRYIRAGAEAAVARRCHGNQHVDVVGRVPGGEARRGPRGLRSPGGVPGLRQAASISPRQAAPRAMPPRRRSVPRRGGGLRTPPVPHPHARAPSAWRAAPLTGGGTSPEPVQVGGSCGERVGASPRHHCYLTSAGCGALGQT